MHDVEEKQILVPDNIPVANDIQYDLIRRAQAAFGLFEFLISGRLIEVLRTGQKETHKIIVSLPYESQFIFKTYSQEKGELQWHVNAIEIITDWHPEQDEYGQQGHIRIHYSSRPSTMILGGFVSFWNPHDERIIFREEFKQLSSQLKKIFPTLLELTLYLRPGLSVDVIRRYCGMNGLVFDGHVRNYGSVYPAHFDDQDGDIVNDLKAMNTGHPEPYYIQMALRQISAGEISNRLPFARYAKPYQDGLTMIFPYKNEYGETEMYETVVYDFERGAKVHIPIISCIGRGTGTLYNFPIPHLKKQPIYNADLIANASAPPTIVITNSVEVAELNQRIASEDVIYTAWMCDEEHFDQVDMTPLAKAKKLVLLIVNHSGKSLAEAYIKADVLRTYLSSLKELKQIPLEFLQAEFDFPSYRVPYSMESLLDTRNSAAGILVDKSSFSLSEIRFNATVKSAKKSLVQPKFRFWQENVFEDGAPNDAETLDQDIPHFIIHPYIIKGEITGIYAKKNHGKSPLAYTLAIAATCCRKKGSGDIFPERSVIAVRNSMYGNHKVLYLDFENGKAEIAKKIKSIGSVYWPSPEKCPQEYQKSKGNFIVKDMQEYEHYGEVFSKIENHQMILDMVETAKQQGTIGQPVDMVVIDTYNKFVGTESIATNIGFSKLTRTLRRMGISVLSLGQLSENDSVRGFKQKMDDEYCTLLLGRDDDKKAHSLETTPLTIMVKNYRGKLTDVQLEDFAFTYPMNQKMIFKNESNSTAEALSKESFQGFIDRYKQLEYNHSQIASMLGMADKTLYGWEQQHTKKN